MFRFCLSFFFVLCFVFFFIFRFRKLYLVDMILCFDALTRAGQPHPKNQDANNSMSSDEEMFLECESGFDLDTTATNVGPSTVTAHSSNIDHNVFDKTINFSTIAANSTAGLGASTAPSNSSQLNEKSDSLFKTSEADHTMLVNQTFEPPLNQTIEMAESDPIDGCTADVLKFTIEPSMSSSIETNVTSQAHVADNDSPVAVLNVTNNDPINGIMSSMNVTIDKEEENVEQNEVTSSTEAEIQQQQQPCVPQNQIPLNITQDLNDVPTSTDDLNGTMDLSQPKEIATPSIESNSANDTFGKDGSDGIAQQMNVTIDTPCAIEEMVDARPEQCALLSQTMPMDTTQDLNDVPALDTVELNNTTDLSKSAENATSSVESNCANETFAKHDVLPQNLNVTVDTAEENLSGYQMTSSVADEIQSPKCALPGHTMPMNVTQDLNEMPTSAAALNQTIDLPNLNENIGTPPAQLDATFAKHGSPAAFNMTHNVDKDILPSTRRSIDAIGTNSSATSHKMNLNETIIVDKKLPCMNTSFIVPPKSNSTPNNDDIHKQLTATPNYDPFKMPTAPATSSNLFEAKLKHQAFDISDDEFQSPGRKLLYFEFLCCCIFRSLSFGFSFFFHRFWFVFGLKVNLIFCVEICTNQPNCAQL